MDLSELRRLCEAATPGPWENQGGASNKVLFGDVENPAHDGDSPYLGTLQNKKDVQFIAAANPQAVLSLIAEIEKLRAENAVMREALEYYADAIIDRKDDEEWQELSQYPGSYNYCIGKRAREALAKAEGK